ncbi:MAG: CvpA family protein [Enterovibrio sp.]
MNWVDGLILGVVALSMLISVVRGFVREALSLVVWFISFLIAQKFYESFAKYFSHFDDPMIQNGIAIGVLFLGSLIIGSIMSNLFSDLIQKSGLSGLDRMIGVIFGGLRGVLIVGAVLFGASMLSDLEQAPAWQQSSMVPHFSDLTQWLFTKAQENPDLFPDLSGKRL